MVQWPSDGRPTRAEGGKAVTVGGGRGNNKSRSRLHPKHGFNFLEQNVNFCSYKTKDIENCVCNLKLDPLNWLFQKHTKVTLQAGIRQKYIFHQPKGNYGK